MSKTTNNYFADIEFLENFPCFDHFPYRWLDAAPIENELPSAKTNFGDFKFLEENSQALPGKSRSRSTCNHFPPSTYNFDPVEKSLLVLLKTISLLQFLWQSWILEIISGSQLCSRYGMLNVELFTFSDKNNFGKFEFLKDVSHGLTGSRYPPQLRPLPQPTSIHRYPLYITFGNESAVSIHTS